MNFFERINQNRENRIFRQIKSGNIDERALIKTFKNSNDKINFITQCNLALRYQLPEGLMDTIIECAEKDTDFLIRVCPLMFRKQYNSNYCKRETKSTRYSEQPRCF